MRSLVRDILDPKSTYELEPVSAGDLARAMAIDAKFFQLGLGIVDGMVAAVAERRRVYRVLTIDRRDFSALRVGTRFDKRLEIVP